MGAVAAAVLGAAAASSCLRLRTPLVLLTAIGGVPFRAMSYTHHLTSGCRLNKLKFTVNIAKNGQTNITRVSSLEIFLLVSALMYFFS